MKNRELRFLKLDFAAAVTQLTRILAGECAIVAMQR
jgi:hypothetical protein